MAEQPISEVEGAGTGAFETLRWLGDRDGAVELVEQTLLPDRFVTIRIESPADMIAAIQRLAVRGAPAIGVAGAYALCLATRGLKDHAEIASALEDWVPKIRAARPTAVNLMTMVDRLVELWKRGELTGTALRDALLAEAQAIHDEDTELCRLIGEAGAALIRDGDRVLTHCNAGALATAGRGTALAVCYAAQEQGRTFSVFADETRPLLQGARLTAWELAQAEIPVTLICDNAAAHLFQRGEISVVITGADRIAANGDAANKIGTYNLAVLAEAHSVPFYIAAPSTTFDFGTATGEDIPIEERSPDEVWRVAAQGPRPTGIEIRNPAFDVTPARLIKGWITEKGILKPPFDEIRPRR